MTGRQSSAVERAVRALGREQLTISAAARRYGVAVSSVRRALRAMGEPPRKPGRRVVPSE